MNNYSIHITNYLKTQSLQIAILVIILAVITFMLKNKSAHVRYLLWLIVLVKCLVPPFLTVPLPVLPAERSTIVFTPPGRPITAESIEAPMANAHSPMAKAPAPLAPAIIKDAHKATVRQWLAGAWILGAGMFVFVAFIKALRTELWLRRERKSLPDGLQSEIEELFSGFRVRILPKLWLVEGIGQPFVWGVLRGGIYLPTNFVKVNSIEHRKGILGHELSHVLRFDAAVNLLQVIAQAVFWFHPFVWWANNKIRFEREKCCDEMVIARLGAQVKDYGNAIVNVLITEHQSTRPVPSLAVAGPVKNIEERIKTMLRPGKKFYRRPSPRVAVVIILTAVLTVSTTMVLTVRAGSEPVSEHDTETALVAAPIPIQPPTFRKIRDLGHYDAQLSPDGKSIALGYAGKLCIIPRDITVGSDDPNISHFVVNTDEIKIDPYGLAWSGNGRWIAFNGLQPVRNGKRVGNYRMYVVSAKGGKPREVYDAYRGGYAHNRQMSLSPNGKTLAFSSVDANELHIYTLPVEGGVSKRLVEAPAREPVFSPDGKMIAYVEDKNLGQEGGGLWIVPANGGTPRQVAEASEACSPIWSPDGRMIAFFDWNNRDEQIWIVPINEDGERAGEKVTIDYPKETGGLYRLTGWTPDNKIGAIFKSPQEFGLYTSPPNGEPATLVTHTEEGGFLQPRWSPDAKRIVYMKAPAEDGSNWMAWGLASIGAEGGRSTMIPIEPDTKMLKAGWGGGGSISPDGKTIVFAGCKAEKAKSDIMHVWTLPMEGGKLTQLTNAPAPQSDKFPCWSPDGKAIAFVRTRDSQNIIKLFTEADIFILPAAGGEPRQLTAEPDMVAFGSIAWSPDGRLLAYFALNPEWPSPEETTIRVIPAEGGQSRVVAKLGKFDANMELAWSPDNRHIAFNAFAGRSINIVSLDDGSVVDVDVHLSSARIHHLDWSRDGEKLVFAGYRGGQMGFWLIENFLPVGMDMKESK
jgi:Tol biopolymer transport system component/beta-lactamase regulating signal transducer with metallopeptidase domain